MTINTVGENNSKAQNTDNTSEPVRAKSVKSYSAEEIDAINAAQDAQYSRPKK